MVDKMLAVPNVAQNLTSCEAKVHNLKQQAYVSKNS